MTGVDVEQAKRDAEYNAAAAVGGPERYYTSWRERSRNTREKYRTAQDIPYGGAPGETLDIVLPNRIGAPVHIFFHGGLWRSQDKANFSCIADSLIDSGAAVVIPNYDHCPAVTISDIVKQTRAAIAWVYRHARIFGGDPNAITLSGHSAGAHLAVCALEADWAPFGISDHPVKAVIGISGLYDLEPLRRTFINEDLRLNEQEALANSPLRYSPRARCPLLLAVGSDEVVGLLTQTENYAKALALKSFDAEHLVVPNAEHYSIVNDAFDPNGVLGRRLHEVVLGVGARLVPDGARRR
jgi:arylformamidase